MLKLDTKYIRARNEYNCVCVCVGVCECECENTITFLDSFV